MDQPGKKLRLAVIGCGKLGRACVAALEQQGHGTVLARRGSAGAAGHQMLLFEARFDAAALAAEVMVAAARALRWMPPGFHALSELPVKYLCPEEIRI